MRRIGLICGRMRRIGKKDVFREYDKPLRIQRMDRSDMRFHVFRKDRGTDKEAQTR